MDNVRTDWRVDWSTFCLAGHADRSHSIENEINQNFHAVQLFQLLAVCSELLCIAEL